MQVVDLYLNRFNFFCPVTGTKILGDEGFKPSSATRGVWSSEVPDEPEVLADEIAADWEGYLSKVEAADDFADPETFLGNLERSNWVAFAITTSGLACGPTSSTVWVVIDLDYEAE